MKQLVKSLFVLSLFSLLLACGGGQSEAEPDRFTGSKDDTKAPVADPKGIGEIKDVVLTEVLSPEMLASGKAIYEMKCSACHKLTDQRVVGPGWAGVTNRRRPEWIMNMITNVDIMLDEDPVAQKMFEECLTRMPNQGVSVEESRDIVEFMRQNDMDQVGEKDKSVLK